MDFLAILVKSKMKNEAVVRVVQQTKEFTAEGLLFAVWLLVLVSGLVFFDKARDVDIEEFTVSVSLQK